MKYSRDEFFNIYHSSAPGHSALLDHHSSVYVPSTYRGKPISDEAHKDIARYISKVMSEHFGGATVHYGHGSWVDSTGQLVEEPVHIVRSAHSSAGDVGKAFRTINAIAHGLGKAMGQHSVAIEHRTPYIASMHFIETHEGAPKEDHFAIQGKEYKRLSEIVRDKITSILQKHGYSSK